MSPRSRGPAQVSRDTPQAQAYRRGLRQIEPRILISPNRDAVGGLLCSCPRGFRHSSTFSAASAAIQSVTQIATINIPTPPTAARAFCENKLAESDVGYFYALLFVPREQRPALAALYALWQELREIPLECSEPDIARVKLEWWHEEIHAMIAGHPRHPVTVALRNATVSQNLPTHALFDAIEAIARRTMTSRFPTSDARYEYAERSRGSIEQLAAGITGIEGSAEIATLGAQIELAQLLRNTANETRRGRHGFAEDEFVRNGFNGADIVAGRSNNALVEFVRTQATRLRNELDASLERLTTRPDVSCLVALIVTARLTLALLRYIEKNPASLLSATPTLYPLRQLWIAWLTARRIR